MCNNHRSDLKLERVVKYKMVNQIDLQAHLTRRQLRLFEIDPTEANAFAKYLAVVSVHGYSIDRLPDTKQALDIVFKERHIDPYSKEAVELRNQAFAYDGNFQLGPEGETHLKLILAGLDPKHVVSREAYGAVLSSYNLPADATLEAIKAALPREDKKVRFRQIFDEFPNYIQALELITPTPPSNTVATIPSAPPTPVDKLSYRAVEAIIRKIYSDPQTVRSTALDILAIYLKGQKILYTEAKTLCEQRLYALMLPAILVSAVCTFLSLYLKDDPNGGLVVSVLNAFNSFLLAVVTYLKLDAKAEAHKTSAYKYDKLQSYCEFNSGKLLFFEDGRDSILGIIEEVETKVGEIKETNQFIIPEQIRHRFRLLYGKNVFATAKTIQFREMQMINNLKGVINALLDLYKQPESPELRSKILDAEQKQNELINKIIVLRNDYTAIDSRFDNEVEAHIHASNRRCCKCMDWLKT